MDAPAELMRQTRLRIAALTATSGAVTAVAITELAGGMRYMLPDGGFHLAAVVGAGLAGFILADGWGRPGWRGTLVALFSALGVTLLGAWLGALLITPITPLGFGAGFLGWIALAEAAAMNPLILKLWAAAMIGLQAMASSLRAAQSPLSP